VRKVEIILVKYNQPHLERDVIRRILDTTNHSDYNLTAYQNEPGTGLATVWNYLIGRSDAEYICLLNTDTVPCTPWLEALTDILDNEPSVAAVVPSSNRVHLSQIETPWMNTFAPYPSEIQEFADKLARDVGPRFEDLVTLSAMCVVFRRSVWEAAEGFDQEFFLYGEDTEFFYRIRKMGLGRLVWHKGVYVHHYGQQSMQAAVRNGELDYFVLRARANKLWERKKSEIDAKYPG